MCVYIGNHIRVSQLRERGIAYEIQNCASHGSSVPTNKPEEIEHPHDKPCNAAAQ